MIIQVYICSLSLERLGHNAVKVANEAIGQKPAVESEELLQLPNVNV